MNENNKECKHHTGIWQYSPLKPKGVNDTYNIGNRVRNKGNVYKSEINVEPGCTLKSAERDCDKWEHCQ